MFLHVTLEDRETRGQSGLVKVGAVSRSVRVLPLGLYQPTPGSQIHHWQRPVLGASRPLTEEPRRTCGTEQEPSEACVHLTQEGNFTGTDQGPKEPELGTGCPVNKNMLAWGCLSGALGVLLRIADPLPPRQVCLWQWPQF